jgi:hypothetical protein
MLVPLAEVQLHAQRHQPAGDQQRQRDEGQNEVQPYPR